MSKISCETEIYYNILNYNILIIYINVNKCDITIQLFYSKTILIYL